MTVDATDADSIANEGLWPWSRKIYADVVDALMALDAPSAPESAEAA